MHTGGEGEGGGTSCTISKDFEKLEPPDFLTTPSTPSKESKNNFASNSSLKIILKFGKKNKSLVDYKKSSE
jgi:hypothetical protein